MTRRCAPTTTTAYMLTHLCVDNRASLTCNWASRASTVGIPSSVIALAGSGGRCAVTREGARHSIALYAVVLRWRSLWSDEQSGAPKHSMNEESDARNLRDE